MKPIRLSAHAQQRILFRGCSAGEVSEAIRTSPWERAELGRLQCRRNFRFEREWHGVWCATKQVRPTFADEPEEIVVVTTVSTKHLGDGIAADYDAEGRLAGIEILDAAKRLGDPGVFRQVIVEGIGSTSFRRRSSGRSRCRPTGSSDP